jgi:hypothetical protein
MLKYWFAGKILKFPISLLSMEKLYYEILSFLILLIFIVEIGFSELFFKNIKYYCLLKHDFLSKINPEN